MDPISLIVAALAAGAAEAAQPTATQAVKDAYTGLKAIISRKLGGQPNAEDLGAAVKGVEKKPADPARKQVLEDELKMAKADQDAEILQAVQALQAQLNKTNGSNRATVTGNGAIAQGTGAIAVGAGGVIVQGSNSGGINTGTQTTHNYYGAANGEAAAANISPAGRRLAELLNQYFDLSEVEGLCFDMDIDKDNLAGATKAAKARALIIYVERNARLAELQTLVRSKRPHLRGQV